MIKPFALLVLLVTASSLTTYTYVFSTTSNGVNQQPSYSLGFLNQTATLTVAMSFPFGGTSPGATLSIMDSLNANTIATLGNCGGTCTFTWTVNASATYYLKVLSSVSTQEFSSYAIYYLTASLSSTSVVLKVTDILRQHVAKMLYVQTGGAVNFTLYPVSDSSSYLSLLTLTYGGSGNPSVTSSVTLTPTSNNNGIATYTQNLTQGYYGIVVTSTASLSAKITTQTDTYACPYSKEYYDIGAVFPGCTSRTASPSGLPCTGYDYTNLVCYSCMSGYSLQGGTCVSTATCGSRQYVNLGTCYNVSSTCDTFDAYLGTCLTCISSDYVLVSGSCILQSQFCSAGYKYINGICVSSTCGTYSQATGECFTCITQAYYLTSGKCLPVDCGANKYYSVNASACINVPTTCSSFSIITEKCISCNDGYYLFQGTCVVLPNTQNCKTYNFTSNTCAACNTGYNLVNGGCTPSVICGAGQTYVNGICILNPSSCTSNQVFLNNQCVDLPSNCLQINIYYQCTKCKDNYQIVAGVCQACTGSNANFPCVICPSGTFVNSNGVCQQANQYCGSFSTSTGVCLTCANGKDPVNGNCCDSGYSYKNGQCTQDSTSGNNNNSGTGNLRSIYGPYCLTINPEKKICTSCLEGHYADQTGYCV